MNKETPKRLIAMATGTAIGIGGSYLLYTIYPGNTTWFIFRATAVFFSAIWLMSLIRGIQLRDKGEDDE